MHNSPQYILKYIIKVKFSDGEKDESCILVNYGHHNYTHIVESCLMPTPIHGWSYLNGAISVA